MPDIYSHYLPSPPFPDGAPLDITAHVGRLHANARLLDALTRDGRDALCSHAYANEPVNDNPHAYGTWALVYRVGAPDLTWHGRKTSDDTSCTMTLRFRANGVLVQEGITLTTGADAAYTWDLTTVVGLTLTDGDVVEVSMELYDPLSPGGPPDGLGSGRAWGVLQTTALYLSSLADIAPAWPGYPIFTTSATAAQMALLSAALDWTATRVALAPRPLFLALAHATGTFSDATSPMQIWRGGGERGTMDRLKVEGAITVVSNPGEQVRLLINGTEAAITATLTPAVTAYAIAFDVDVSGYASDARLQLEIQDIRSDTTGTRPSRITIRRVWFASSAAPTTLPTLPAPEASGAWSVAKAYLNDLGIVVEAWSTTRIGDHYYSFAYAHAFRQNYAYDTGEKRYFDTRHVAYGRRRGSRLLVRGRGVKIGWGAPTWELVDDTEPDGPYTLTSAFEATLIGGTAWDAEDATGIETRLFHLDEIGVPPGVYYILTGEVRYAGEYL